VRIEAKTLEEAYLKASEKFNCSVTELNITIIQHPSSGFLGMFAKNAVIEVEEPQKQPEPQKELNEIPQVSKEEIKEEKTEIKPKEVKAIKPRDDLKEIKEKLIHLFNHSCFNVDTVEVSKLNEETLAIKIDGEDAALLIGKEGYRYNALNYMVYGWINQKYGYKVRLEIAEFLKKQEEMLRSFLAPFIEKVKERGFGKTKPFNGILAFLALEILRKEFPDKYVAIRERNGEKFVIIGERYEDNHSNSDS